MRAGIAGGVAVLCSGNVFGCALAPSDYCLRQVLAYVNRVRDVTCDVDNETFTLADVEANDVRCPDQEAAKAMYKGARSEILLMCACGAAMSCMLRDM